MYRRDRGLAVERSNACDARRRRRHAYGVDRRPSRDGDGYFHSFDEPSSASPRATRARARRRRAIPPPPRATASTTISTTSTASMPSPCTNRGSRRAPTTRATIGTTRRMPPCAPSGNPIGEISAPGVDSPNTEPDDVGPDRSSPSASGAADTTQSDLIGGHPASSRARANPETRIPVPPPPPPPQRPPPTWKTTRIRNPSSAGASVPEGLSSRTLRALPHVVFESRGGTIVRGGGSECAVCLADFEPGEELVRLPRCGHFFHRGCVSPWLERHRGCPKCRTEVDEMNANDHGNTNVSEGIIRVGSAAAAAALLSG